MASAGMSPAEKRGSSPYPVDGHFAGGTAHLKALGHPAGESVTRAVRKQDSYTQKTANQLLSQMAGSGY